MQSSWHDYYCLVKSFMGHMTRNSGIPLAIPAFLDSWIPYKKSRRKIHLMTMTEAKRECRLTLDADFRITAGLSGRPFGGLCRHRNGASAERRKLISKCQMAAILRSVAAPR